MAEKPGYTPVSIFAAACGAAASAVATACSAPPPVAAGIGTAASAIAGGIELNEEKETVKESLDQAMEKAWAEIDRNYRLTLHSETCLSELKREIMGEGTSVDEFIRNKKDKGVWPSITIVIASILEKHRDSLNRDSEIVWNDCYIENAAKEMASILKDAISGVFEKEDLLRVLMAIAEGKRKIGEAISDSEVSIKKTVLGSENNIKEAVGDSENEVKKALGESENRIIKAFQEQNQSTTSGGIASLPGGKPDTASAPDVLDFLMVRQLAQGLFVNWRTGCLAGDFRSALAALDGGDGEENALPVLSESQLRLLSVLVQNEGAVVSWRDIFRRGKLLPKWQEKYVMPEAADAVSDNGRIGEAMLSRLQRKPDQGEMQEISEEAIDELNQAMKAARKTTKRHGSDREPEEKEVILEKAEKGCRINLIRDARGDLFSEYGVCGDGKTCHDKDFRLLRDELKGEGLPSPRESCRNVSLWLRRYYGENCSFFEDRVSNKGSGGSNEKEIFGDYKMAQAYIIPYVDKIRNLQEDGSEVFSDREEAKLIEKGKEKEGQEDAAEAMLDFVEGWHLALEKQLCKDKEVNRVLVLHGQPGDGKTTFCKKAVYAHCKEGWLPETSHVLQFSLNPSDNKIIGEEGVDLAKAFCITNGNRRYPLDVEESCEELSGSLVILDGYDELAGSLGAGYSFKDFCGLANRFAADNECTVIITSRTMCIKAELEVGMLKNIPTARFAPLTREQQDAMIDRMIELDAPKKPEKEGSVDSFRNGEEEKELQKSPRTLEEYRDEVLKEKIWESQDEKLEDFKELLKIPLLFRMIVTSRFDKFEGVGTVAELYGQLFYQLLDQKDGVGREKVDKQKLVREYENIAVRVFNYDGDTCPFSVKKEADKKELVYYFYTKWGKDGKGYLGFLHGSFYQYFLARYIVAFFREFEERVAEGDITPFERLFLSLSAEKLTDPDMWKLVTQLARIDQARENREDKYLQFHDYAERIQKSHIKRILECLNDGDPFSCKMPEKYAKLFVRKEDRNGCSPYEGMENAVSNLLSACAAIENGCSISDASNGRTASNDRIASNERIAYRSAAYPKICGLLKIGNYSGIYLNGIDLAGCDLKYARLAGAYLSGANLNGALLDGADLSGAKLGGAVLCDAVLAGADLSGATLSGARLHKAELAGASLKGAVLKAAVLESAKMKGADLRGAVLEGAALHGAVLEGADLHGANLSGLKASPVHMEGDDQKGVAPEAAVLEPVHMEKADLEGADLRKAHLEKAFLTGANLAGSDLEGAHLEGSDLGQACLKEACLAGAWLIGAKLERACIKGACLDKAHLKGAELRDACMKGAYLAGAELDEKVFKSLEGADLQGAVFDEAQLEQAEGFGIADLKERRKAREKHALPAALRDKLVLPAGEKGSLEGKGGRTSFMPVFGRGAYSSININTVNKGDKVWFGRYPQENKSEDGSFIPEPLLWRVLRVDQERSRVLLITEKLIDCLPYHERFEDVAWERCTLRKWMNDEFIRTAFTPEETSLIARVWNQNYDNPRWDTPGGNATYDKVFALSIGEAGGNARNREQGEEAYFEEDIDRQAAVTYYAKERGSYIDDDYKVDGGETGWWWLRLPGTSSLRAAIVYGGGGVLDFGDRVDNSAVSVRPALWLNL